MLRRAETQLSESTRNFRLSDVEILFARAATEVIAAGACLAFGSIFIKFPSAAMFSSWHSYFEGSVIVDWRWTAFENPCSCRCRKTTRSSRSSCIHTHSTLIVCPLHPVAVQATCYLSSGRTAALPYRKEI